MNRRALLLSISLVWSSGCLTDGLSGKDTTTYEMGQNTTQNMGNNWASENGYVELENNADQTVSVKYKVTSGESSVIAEGSTELIEEESRTYSGIFRKYGDYTLTVSIAGEYTNSKEFRIEEKSGWRGIEAMVESPKKVKFGSVYV